MPASITLDCPSAGANVPAVFSVSGTYSAPSTGNSVRCTLAYLVGQVPQRLCRVCVVNENSNPATWCCRFDMSGNPPAGGAFLGLSAVLYDSNGVQIAGPVTSTATYNAQASDPCSCTSAGTACP